MTQTQRNQPAPSAATPPLGVWVRTARPLSLSASISPILVGAAVAADTEHFAAGFFALTLASGIFLQIGTNYFNEYFDFRYGLDTAASLGASTVIFRGELTARQVFRGGALSFALAAALGLVLTLRVGPAILLFGLAAVLIGYFYSARPFTLAARGLGDPLVYLAMGFLMTWGAYYVQIRAWSWAAFAASVPVGLLVVAILNMNNLRDYPDDLAVAKYPLPVRFGEPFGRRYQATLMLGAYAATTIGALARLLPPTSLAVWLTFPVALSLTRAVLTARDRQVFVAGMRRVSRLHLQFGLALALGIALAALVRLKG